MEKHEELLSLTDRELLTEILLELRQNTFAVEHLQDIAADIYGLQKELAWDRY